MPQGSMVSNWIDIVASMISLADELSRISNDVCVSRYEGDVSVGATPDFLNTHRPEEDAVGEDIGPVVMSVPFDFDMYFCHAW